MIIKQDLSENFSDIYCLVKEAFKSAKFFKRGDECERVKFLRESSGFIPELSLVVKEENQIIAYNILTKFNMHSTNKNIKSLLLGPICVKSEYRNRGVGRSIINKSLELAKNLGYEVVFLFGNQKYYTRLGFKQTIDYGIECLNKNIPAENAMLIELVPNILKNINGTILFEF